MSRLLEARIVPTVGNKSEGRDALLDAIIETAREGRKPRTHGVHYGGEIEEELARIESAVLAGEKELADRYGPRWIALKLLEQDDEIVAKVQSREVLDAVNRSVGRLRGLFRDEPEIVLADRRYGFISGACQETIKNSVERRHDVSDTIDAIVTHKVLGLPIFLLLMYAVFFLTFTVGRYPMGWLESLFGWSARAIGNAWPADTALWLRSLVVDGIIGGVGGVLVFLPNILLLFLAIALLEDSGYMARAAFVMDRIMHKIGLHGKSFIPMLIGFGCSVPAIMATRILENRRNRLTTIMVIPLMSCGARLTIYALFIPAFFSPHWRGPVLWIIYVIGIVLAVILAKVLRMTLFRGETVPFVMELPPYRMPTGKAMLIHTWQRGWMYLRKAGTVILAASVILWAAANYPRPSEKVLAGLSGDAARQTMLQHSIVGRLGRTIEPVLKPLGFDWKIGTALIGAVPAKEALCLPDGHHLCREQPWRALPEPAGKTPGRLHAAGRLLRDAVHPDQCSLHGYNCYDATGNRFLALGDFSASGLDGPGLCRHARGLSNRPRAAWLTCGRSGALKQGWSGETGVSLGIISCAVISVWMPLSVCRAGHESEHAELLQGCNQEVGPFVATAGDFELFMATIRAPAAPPAE